MPAWLSPRNGTEMVDGSPAPLSLVVAPADGTPNVLPTAIAEPTPAAPRRKERRLIFMLGLLLLQLAESGRDAVQHFECAADGSVHRLSLMLGERRVVGPTGAVLAGGQRRVEGVQRVVAQVVQAEARNGRREQRLEQREQLPGGEY